MTLIRGVFVIALLLLLPVAADATAATSGQLVVKHGRGGWHYADAFLRPKRALAIPRASDGTLLSPDGSRALAYEIRGKMSLVDLRRNRVLVKRSLREAVPVAWPTKQRVITLVEEDPHSVVIRSYNLRTGAVRTVTLKAQYLDDEVIGRRVRVAVADPRGQIFALDVDPRGRVVARRRVRFGPGRSFYTTVELSGNYAIVSDYEHHELARIGGASRTVDLPPGFYRWAGRRFVFAYETAVARADLRTLSVGSPVALDPENDQEVQPYHGGLLVGFGRRRLSADLADFGGFPDLPATEGFPILFGHRLYDFRDDCSDFAGGFAVADADTGTLLRYVRRSVVRFGVLGAGDLRSSSSEDRCPDGAYAVD